MTQLPFQLIENEGAVPIKAWVNGVPFDKGAQEQVRLAAQLPIIYKWIALMPDVHKGIGATVGSVIPTTKAIIPAAVGVDIGCGMMAVRTDMTADQLPDNLKPLRTAIEKAVPHGRTSGSRKDKGSWQDVPTRVAKNWASLNTRFGEIVRKHPAIEKSNHVTHLGTLGTGNHFIELCLDEANRVWIMLHSGSRGVGNRIGSYFIELAKKDMRGWHANLPDVNLSYLREGTEHFDDYVEAVDWAQDFARQNRALMMENVIKALREVKGIPTRFKTEKQAVNCHHNYVSQEIHFGNKVWVTRKGAVSARQDELGIIPGSMGARSFIVRGRGNPESFHSCSHGAGRVMSRTQAKKRISLDEHQEATAGVECRKDAGVIDETPAAYKPIDAVMKAQSDLVEVVHTLKQIVCVKG
ncbi:RtcB family protein [Acanthopleuribacter pedis]|uniref:3'-phosphate/5'-hydroxy nucleic acid ligase n=1 Tax=Acanthopleuribacter pedis TaxID=442870 RepID=A0A8J7Q1W6_9BACT|nr:RtcB family protein [Acanthopleuribacter pedis]MBO1318952.1 RtcB family protein [Acanthopleuribacter pedis]